MVGRVSAPIDTVLGIDTPEHLLFRVRIAGPVRRLFAWTIDLMVRIFIFWAIAMVVGIISAATSLTGIGSGFVLLLVFALDWFYFVVFELITGGRSPGKMWLKLRVVRENGLPITWRESALRNLLRAADLMLLAANAVLPLGPIVMALDPKFRRLGDFVAGTIVVVEEPAKVQVQETLAPDPTVDLPAGLPIHRDDLEALELFVHRAQMSDARREELARIVAPEYARRLGLPEPKNASGFLAALWARSQDPKRRMI